MARVYMGSPHLKQSIQSLHQKLPSSPSLRSLPSPSLKSLKSFPSFNSLHWVNAPSSPLGRSPDPPPGHPLPAVEFTPTMPVESEDRFKNLRVYWIAFAAFNGILLFGYDTGIAGGVVASPYFQSHFGLDTKAKVTDVSSNVVSVLQAGAFFGALGSAPISSYFGRKKTMLGFTLIFLIGAILATVASGGHTGLSLIYAGRIISGLGIGGISAVAPAYVSECAPKQVRGRITGLFQVCVAIGSTLSYFVNFGISLHIKTGTAIWRIPFAVQIIPCGIMLLALPTCAESPRWLASVGQNKKALENLAYLRKETISSTAVMEEMAQIEAQIREERESRVGLGIKEALFGKGNFIRFFIAITIFLLQQWSGQNSIAYYAPQFFASIGYRGTTQSLLASGLYGLIKVFAIFTFVFFLIDRMGRKLSLFLSAVGMGLFFFIIGAIDKTHPPPAATSSHTNVTPTTSTKAMAAMIYLYGVCFSLGMGPIPWVYVSEIFPTRTRAYGMSTASASQWLFNYVISKVTPSLEASLGYKIFFLFATINIGGMAIFALLIPETRNKTLEEIDILFGSVSAEKRSADVLEMQRNMDRGPSMGLTHDVDRKGSLPPTQEEVEESEEKV